MLVSSGRFTDDDRSAKESHSESASSCGLGCVGGLGAVPFTALIRLHTSAELMLPLHSEIHWFQDRFLTWVHSAINSLYAACISSRLACDVCPMECVRYIQRCSGAHIPAETCNNETDSAQIWHSHNVVKQNIMNVPRKSFTINVQQEGNNNVYLINIITILMVVTRFYIRSIAICIE